MIRQYNPGRQRRIAVAGRILAVGTVPVGTIAIVGGRKLRVEAWLPRDYSAVERGRFVTKRIAGGHLAQVRDLATGRVGRLSDAWLLDAETVDDPMTARAIRRRDAARKAAADLARDIAAVAEEERAGEAYEMQMRDRAYFAEGV